VPIELSAQAQRTTTSGTFIGNCVYIVGVNYSSISLRPLSKCGTSPAGQRKSKQPATKASSIAWRDILLAMSPGRTDMIWLPGNDSEDGS
jgi:hypothetical protein